jgi:hypothetical protein
MINDRVSPPSKVHKRRQGIDFLIKFLACARMYMDHS